MASLKSVDDVEGIDYYEYRDRDYYSKFKYRARVRFHGLALTYYAKDIDQFLERLDKANLRWRRLDKNLVRNNLEVVTQFLDLKNTIKKDSKNFMIRIEGDTAAIFCNDLAKIQNLLDIPNLDVDYTEAITSSFSGTKYFVREPKHKFRVYFKSKIAEQSTVSDLKEILSKNRSLHPSKALLAWLYKTRQNTWHHRYISSAFSIDYDDENTISYLAIMLGDLLGHKYKLEKRPDPI